MAGERNDATDAMYQRGRDAARPGEPLDVAAEFMDLPLRIASQTLLSIDLGGDTDRIRQAITVLAKLVGATPTILDALCRRLLEDDGTSV